MARKAHDTIIDAGDVLIIGAGLAGLYTALKLSPRPSTILASSCLGDGAASAWAQGGIAAAVREGDTWQAHAADTVAAGAGIVDPFIANLMASEARSGIEDLLRLGVPFDRDEFGNLLAGREAAHGADRIVHVAGDRAGRAIMQALTARAVADPAISILDHFVAFELAVEDGRVVGVYARPAASAGAAFPILIRAKAVVLASGGIGQLYAVTTNPSESRGEGLAMAARAGARIADPEFVQFHPTAIDVGKDPAPLATEALRGAGAHLINAKGQRFMTAVHEDAELAPRDIVARAIHREIQAGRGAFLDTRDCLGKNIADAFPTVAEHCRAAGIDPIREPIPVAPAAHYHMGGVAVDANGRTSLDGLWACGEVASTGAHGANRLASNSLLEAVVFGARVAEDIAGVTLGEAGRSPSQPLQIDELARGASALSQPVLAELRETMSAHVGVERDRDGLVIALQAIARIEKAVAPSSLCLNMITVAKLVAAAALRREESRGGHFRRDHPDSSPDWQHRTFLTLSDADAYIAEIADAPVHSKSGAKL